MARLDEYIKEKHIRFIDHSQQTTILGEQNSAFISFAIDDALATTVGDQSVPPTVRIWVHEPTLVMGIPDARLPYVKDGIHLINEHQYNVIVRNSGGLAVLLDRGVLNMSLILPNDGSMSIYDGYDMMLHFVRTIFQPYTTQIKAYEIKGSYCPGDYDLSINGIKFAGISQRRVRQGVAVQIYIDVEGSSYQRASLVRDFYQTSMKGRQTKHTYPEVDPHVMGTISQLTGHPFTVDEVIGKIKSTLQESFMLTNDAFTPEEERLFQQRLLQMKKRNEKVMC